VVEGTDERDRQVVHENTTKETTAKDLREGRIQLHMGNLLLVGNEEGLETPARRRERYRNATRHVCTELNIFQSNPG
jgi:hypothetical protein